MDLDRDQARQSLHSAISHVNRMGYVLDGIDTIEGQSPADAGDPEAWEAIRPALEQLGARLRAYRDSLQDEPSSG